MPDEPGLWIWNVIPHHSTAVTAVDAVNVCYLASSTSGHLVTFSAGHPAC